MRLEKIRERSFVVTPNGSAIIMKKVLAITMKAGPGGFEPTT